MSYSLAHVCTAEALGDGISHIPRAPLAMEFVERDADFAVRNNDRIGTLPIRCVICGLPLGDVMRLVATVKPGKELRQAFLDAGINCDRLCCRDAGLSRIRTAVTLAHWMGRLDVKYSETDDVVLKAWSIKYGPFAFLKRAEQETVQNVMNSVVLREQQDSWIKIEPKEQIKEYLLDDNGTRYFIMKGTISLKLGDRNIIIGQDLLPVLHFPSCGAINGEALRINGRLYAPISTANFKCNRIIVLSKGDASVQVCFSSMDPRRYEGRLGDERAPSLVPLRIKLSYKKTSDQQFAANNVPVVRVLDVLADNGCTLRAWLSILADIGEIEHWMTTFNALVTDWEHGDEDVGAPHQRALILKRCLSEDAGNIPDEKVVERMCPHLYVISDRKKRAREAFRLMAQMVKRGSQVYYGRASQDDPQAQHSYEDIGHSLSCEAILALRQAASGALRAALTAEDPLKAASLHLSKTTLYMACEALCNNRKKNIARKEITTYKERRHPVCREISSDVSFATLNGRRISPHDGRMEPRTAKLRDDGFVDTRDTNDTNPGQRSYMALGTIVSRRVEWDSLLKVMKFYCDRRGLAPDDPLVPLGEDQRLLTVCGVPLARYSASISLEESLLSGFMALDEHFEETSFEVTLYGLDVNGLPGRLLRPVLSSEPPSEHQTWDSLRRKGVVRLLSQDEQLFMQVLCAEDRERRLPYPHTAREISPLLRSAYRVSQLPQMNNGHPSRASYCLKQAAAGSVNGEMFPTLAGIVKTVGAPSLLCEGSLLSDTLRSLPDEYVGVPMAVSFGCAGGLNQEDSIAVPARYCRGLWTARDVGVQLSLKPDQKHEKSPSDLNVVAGQTIATFSGSSARNNDTLISTVNGRIIAAFRECSRVVAIVRQFLPLIEGHKIGFIWQKMTICLDPDPKTCCGLEISGIMHPPSQYSRQSPAQILQGMQRLLSSALCASNRLASTPSDLRSILGGDTQLTSSERRRICIDAEEVNHTFEYPIHNDATGKYMGRSMVLLQLATQTSKNNPLLALNAHTRPGKGGRGLGPRQEWLMSEHQSALGYNAAVEECAPDVNFTEGRERLRRVKVCCECDGLSCGCKARKRLALVPPKLMMTMDLLGSAQIESSLKLRSTPAFPERERSRSRSREERHPPTTRAEQHCAAMAGTASSLTSPLIEKKLEKGERILIFKGLGASLIGRTFVALLVESEEVALTRTWDSTAATAVLRGSLEQAPFVVRIRPDEASLWRAEKYWHSLLREILMVENALKKTYDNEHPEPHRFVLTEKRYAVNLVRIYARDVLTVPRFHLCSKQPIIHQDEASGRLLVARSEATTMNILNTWANAHYEWTALAETLVSIPLRPNIPSGPLTISLDKTTDDVLVKATDLKCIDDGNSISELKMDILPRLPKPAHEVAPERFHGVIKRVSPSDSEGHCGYVFGGAAASALPFARINESWIWKCDFDVLQKHPREAAQLFRPSVCPRGLFLGAAVPSSAAEASSMSARISASCDGCGACVDVADHMLFADIEDIDKTDYTALAERAAAGRPIKGVISLEPDNNKTVLLAATGNPAEKGGAALLRAARELRVSWEHAW